MPQVRHQWNLPYLSTPSFVVDGMLGSIARKLRILGFDTLYDPVMDDPILLETAAATGRILLTNDVELFLLAKRRRIPVIRSGAKTECDRLYEILANTGQARIELFLWIQDARRAMALWKFQENRSGRRSFSYVRPAGKTTGGAATGKSWKNSSLR